MNTQTQEAIQSNQTVTENETPAAAESSRKLISTVRRKTRKRFTAEEKIRIVLEGFSREFPVSDLCRKESISTAIYYSWLKSFMEAVKSRLKGDFTRDADAQEVSRLRKENSRLKGILAEITLERELFKKSLKA